MVCRIGAFSMRRSALCQPSPRRTSTSPGLAGGSWLRGTSSRRPSGPSSTAVLPSQRSRIYSSFCDIGQCTVLDGKYDIAPLVGAQHRAAPGLQLCQHTGAWMAVGVASPHADDAILGVGGIQQLGTGGERSLTYKGLLFQHQRLQAFVMFLPHRIHSVLCFGLVLCIFVLTKKKCQFLELGEHTKILAFC